MLKGLTHQFRMNTSVKYCFADGKRGDAPNGRKISSHKDDGIRALAIDLDLTYADAREFVELEIPPDKLERDGVPKEWMAKYFDYAGYVKAPQPSSTLRLCDLIDILPTNHRVMLEVNGENYALLVDGVLYDLTDWREDYSRRITGYWTRRRLNDVIFGTLKGSIFDSSNSKVVGFESPDILPRNTLELAGYAFNIRRLNQIWKPDEEGNCTFQATFEVNIRGRSDSLCVQSKTIRCSPRSICTGMLDSGRIDQEHSYVTAGIEERLMSDARRFLNACGLEYELHDNAVLGLGKTVGYQPKSGTIYIARERCVKPSRGLRALLKAL